MNVRRAHAGDAADLWAWRNDPHTRAMSISSAEVSWSEHLAWFTRALADPARAIYIGIDAGEPIGMCRFDFGADATADVSINLAPHVRGRGLSVALLRAAIDAVRATREVALTATIRLDNGASIACFTACGFIRTGNDDVFGFFRRS